jgi:ubiquinone/menaquinone biosynthesis C-methylase UbiE
MKSRKDRERELHKKLALEYDAKREGTRNGRFYSKSWLKYMLKFLPKRKLSILEVGCGTGLLYEVIQEGKFKHRYTGTDFSPDMVKVGKTRYRGINIKVDDAEKMSFKDNSFDVVIMKAVLHHIPRPEKAVSEMHYHDFRA